MLNFDEICDESLLKTKIRFVKYFPSGRREQTTCRKFDKFERKNDNILEFHDHIWKHHEKCIQKSTNMPGTGSIFCEMGFEIENILRKERIFLQGKTNVRVRGKC